MAILEYSNGVSFAKASACEMGGFLRRQLVVSGTKGTIELNPLEVTEGELQYTCRSETYDFDWHKPAIKSTSPLHDRYDTMMCAFARMVVGVMKNPYSYDYELQLHQILLMCCGVELA